MTTLKPWAPGETPDFAAVYILSSTAIDIEKENQNAPPRPSRLLEGVCCGFYLNKNNPKKGPNPEFRGNEERAPGGAGRPAQVERRRPTAEPRCSGSSAGTRARPGSGLRAPTEPPVPGRPGSASCCPQPPSPRGAGRDRAGPGEPLPPRPGRGPNTSTTVPGVHCATQRTTIPSTELAAERRSAPKDYNSQHALGHQPA